MKVNNCKPYRSAKEIKWNGIFICLHTISGWTTIDSSPLKHDEHPVPMVIFLFSLSEIELNKRKKRTAQLKTKQ